VFNFTKGLLRQISLQGPRFASFVYLFFPVGAK